MQGLNTSLDTFPFVNGSHKLVFLASWSALLHKRFRSVWIQHFSHSPEDNVLAHPKKCYIKSKLKNARSYQIKESQSQILMPHVIKVQSDKNTPYRQLKKQQLGKQSRKLQPWFTGLLELAQQRNEAPNPQST